MPEATTLEVVQPVVKSSEPIGFEAYTAPQDLQSALAELRKGDISKAPGLPVLELTDSNPVVKEPQQSGEIRQTQASQSSAESKAEPWWERNWVPKMPIELQEYILCSEIRLRLGVSCDILKKGQESSAATVIEKSQ